ncbi:hypothetical protein [Roseobacter sp. AzwK-3b]|uniref:hypothetical protein n=1 Tax=Roseobacter sp. AzwK-3b TaxID=351016 RepID=UPI0018DD3FFB|nr:hypothetical protein [Roseobacter sp. AzwK-3b]
MNSDEPPSKKSERPSHLEDPVELIYMHFDGIKQTLPFRLADYGDNGALSEDHIEILAQSFQLDTNLTRYLSVLLGYSLDIDSEVNLVRIRRDDGGTKRHSQENRFRKLYFEEDGTSVPVRPLDKRNVQDERRLKVIETCCYIWLDAGRPLTITTRPDKPSSEQREGELINFIQDVVSMITTPKCKMSGETLRRDIERVRRRFRRRGELDPVDQS